MEPSFSALSIGLLNPLLHLLVKSGKMESIMKHLLDLVEESFGFWELEEIYRDMVDINPGLSSGPSYTHLKEGPAGAPHDVLGWIEEAGIQPSNGMYCDVFSFAQKSGATDASIIEERVGSLRILIWERSLEKQGEWKELWSRKCVTALVLLLKVHRAGKWQSPSSPCHSLMLRAVLLSKSFYTGYGCD
ncbi:hypothetical protein H0E87_027128 [Populus deltoides]|uniref:Uncharacterized protein n=1 Tax=Populus deltoides TaxID=3696 RepID=A0A8T2X0S8_POPDE|nr:hypothetical protein H0E87_027128 [Populus deltoides]